MASTRASIRLVQELARERQAAEDESGAGAPPSRAATPRPRARAPPPSPAARARARTASRSPGSTAAAAGERTRQLLVERLDASLLEPLDDARAHVARRRGAQLKVGERRLEVEAGAAHHDRAATGGESHVDLLVRQLREAACEEKVFADRHEGDQPVLEPLPLLRRRGAPSALSSPRYTWSASAEITTGSSPRSRSRSATSIATEVFPTPVGPKMAMTAAGAATTAGDRRLRGLRHGPQSCPFG